MKNKLTILFLIIFGTAMYGLTLHGQFGNLADINELMPLSRVAGTPFESSHERAPYAQMLSIFYQHSSSLKKELADFATPDVGFYGGKYFSYFPPGVSVFMIPGYSLGLKYDLGQLFAYAVVGLISLCSLLLIFKISRDVFALPLWAALAGAMTFGFASTSWSYAVTAYQHAFTTFFLLLIFYAAWRYKQNRFGSFFWGCIVWLGYGLSWFIDYPNALLLAPIVVYFILSALSIKKDERSYALRYRVSVIVTSLLFILVTGLHLYYNNAVYGHWKRFSNTFPRYEIKNADALAAQDLNKVLEKKEDIGGTIFQEKRLPIGVYRLLVAPDKGLLLFSPIFVLAIVGMWFSFEAVTVESGVLTVLVLTNLFLYASFSDSWGGWAFGPRYLIPAMASLSIFVGMALAYARKQWFVRIFAFLLAAFSSAVALLGVLTTNLVPPQVEADYLGLKHNFLLNWDYLHSEKASASFFYNNYFSHRGVSLVEYYYVILGVVLLVFAVTLFILPIFEKKES